MAKERKRKENLRQHDAYLYWYWHPQRSVVETAKKFSVSIGAIYHWSKHYGWAVRAEEWDNKVKQAAANQAHAEGVAVRERQLKLARQTQEYYAERLKPAVDVDGQAVRRMGVTAYEPTAADAQRWAGHELLLLGHVTHRSEVTVGRTTVDTLVASLVALLRKIIPNACPHCNTNLGLGTRVVSELLALSHDMDQRQREEQIRAEARERDADKAAAAARAKLAPHGPGGKDAGRVKPPLDIVPPPADLPDDEDC